MGYTSTTWVRTTVPGDFNHRGIWGPVLLRGTRTTDIWSRLLHHGLITHARTQFLILRICYTNEHKADIRALLASLRAGRGEIFCFSPDSFMLLHQLVVCFCIHTIYQVANAEWQRPLLLPDEPMENQWTILREPMEQISTPPALIPTLKVYTANGMQIRSGFYLARGSSASWYPRTPKRRRVARISYTTATSVTIPSIFSSSFSRFFFKNPSSSSRLLFSTALSTPIRFISLIIIINQSPRADQGVGEGWRKSRPRVKPEWKWSTDITLVNFSIFFTRVYKWIGIHFFLSMNLNHGDCESDDKCGGYSHAHYNLIVVRLYVLFLVCRCGGLVV